MLNQENLPPKLNAGLPGSVKPGHLSIYEFFDLNRWIDRPAESGSVARKGVPADLLQPRRLPHNVICKRKIE